MSTTGTGIEDFKVNLDDQYVEVTGTIPLEELTRRIEKTGKEVSPFIPDFHFSQRDFVLPFLRTSPGVLKL